MNPTSKTQIDRLGDRLRKGKFGDEEVRQLDEFRRSFTEAYEEVVGIVRKATQLQPTGRPAKSTTSIIEKLRRETMRLTQMQDIAGCRLVVQGIVVQDKVVAELKNALPSAVVVDRREQPSHGYRAVHIIATAQGKLVEIQVRTELQHLWAQLSEKLSDVSDPGIKYGGGNPLARELMSISSRTIAGLESMEEDVRESETLTRGLSPDLQRQGVALKENFERLRKEARGLLEESIAKYEASSTKQTGGTGDLSD